MSGGSSTAKRHRDAGQHEQRHDPEHARPRQMVGEDQRERPRNEARDPVRVDVERIAESELDLRKDFAAIRVEHDVLARAEERDRGGEVGDRPEVLLRVKLPEQRDRREQQELRDEHPTAAPSQHGKRVAVEQRRPQELPCVRQLDQREEADRLQVHLLRAQPRGQQIDEQIERQARREAGEDADQHPPVEERLAPAGAGRRRGGGLSVICGF